MPSRGRAGTWLDTRRTQFTDEAPDDARPRLGAWLELRATDPAATLRAALDAGLVEVKHPGHPYYFMLPGGQVFTVAQAGH